MQPYPWQQQALTSFNTSKKIFVQGNAGSGKTSLAIMAYKALLARGVPAENILLFTPQREYQAPYRKALESDPLVLGNLQTSTLAGLSRRMVDLFWPLISGKAGFGQPGLPPTFLTLETAQYQMMSILQPYLDLGRFSSLIVDKNRLSSQILDNLNKAALVGIDLHAIGDHLASAWAGDPAHLSVYGDAQNCIELFRQKCLQNNLVDTSLQIELFTRYLWPEKMVRDHLVNGYTHIIYDNCEEDTPAAHDLLADWLACCQQALVIHDDNAGFRRFLGADPISALRLRDACTASVTSQALHSIPTPFASLSTGLQRMLAEKQPPDLTPDQQASVRQTASFITSQYHPEMLQKVARQIEVLVKGGTPCGEIAVLAPYLNDPLWFSVQTQLQGMGIPSSVRRPSRSLADEPIIQCAITYAQICHPAWGYQPTTTQFVHALFQSIQGIDLVRAKLLAEIAYRANGQLSPFSQIRPEMIARIRPENGQAYEHIRAWVNRYRAQPPLELDAFFRKLFGEVLSQPGFQLRQPSQAVWGLQRLVESAQKFRQSLPESNNPPASSAGSDFIRLLESGVIAAYYQDGPDEDETDRVRILPAIAYLLEGRSSAAQFWLDAGSAGWFERIDQPLTHPYVLNRNWRFGQKWTDTHEYEANMKAMNDLVQGLLLRCTGHVYICSSQYNETGYEQKGPLVQAAQRLL